MLIEQAFMSIPEIMLGSGYVRQEYEAGIISAFSLAILQELNGKNVPKPISCMCAERKYLQEFGLRADLFVDLSNTLIGSSALSNYGFRFRNWIESKYFRHTKGTIPSTQNLGLIVRDLLRLMSLPPLEVSPKKTTEEKLSMTGRYLLHVYQGDPLKYLSLKRKGKNTKERIWPAKLLESGYQEVDSLELEQEPKSFQKIVGEKLITTKVTFGVTNFILRSINYKKIQGLTFALSRIEFFSLEFENQHFEIRADRSFGEAEKHKWLQNSFAKELMKKSTKESELSSKNDLGDDEYVQEDDTP